MKKKILLGFGVLIVIVTIGQALGIIKPEEKETQPTTTISQTTETQTTTITPETISEENKETTSEAEGYTLKHGELVNVIETEVEDKSVFIVQAKISSSYSNKATIDQNYYNVSDLIQNQGVDKFDEIQYWAMADMSDGSEQKVISFTVSNDLIQLILNKSVVDNQLGDYVDDLYVHPSLIN